MRLVDADAKTNEIYVSQFVIDQMQKIPAIDPIRAAGGCRCGECKYCENLGENKALRCGIETNNVLMGLPFITPDDFCSYGEAREVQNDG